MNKKENIISSEEIILEILECDNPLIIRQIIRCAKEKREWADSTIKTFVRRLVENEYVTKEEVEEALRLFEEGEG